MPSQVRATGSLGLGAAISLASGSSEAGLRSGGVPINWSQCRDVESTLDWLSDVPVVRGNRVPATALIENADEGYSPEQIVTEVFPTVPLESARRIIAYATAYDPRPVG